MENEQYTLEYFIAKFEAIPEDQWTTGLFEDSYGCKCAYGHLGQTETSSAPESDAMITLLNNLGASAADLAFVNDGDYNNKVFGSTPKQRIVNYLKSLKSPTQTG